MGKMQRDKGKVGEREAARELSRLFKVNCVRGAQHRGGPTSPDVVNLPGVHVEVKRVEKLRLLDAVAQAQRESGAGEVPLVLHRVNQGPWLVTLPLESLPDLIYALVECLR